MNKKISQFELTNSFNDGDVITLVQNNTNKIISKESFNTNLSDTFATNDNVKDIQTDLDNLNTKVDSNYNELSDKIVDGDNKVTQNLSSTVNSYYDVLNNKIIGVEQTHEKDMSEINGTVQEWIDEIDNKSSLQQLHDLLNRVLTTENLVTELADLIANGGGGSGNVPGFHTQSTATIFPLSGYYYTGSAEDLATTDTLNQALAKLEGKIKAVEGSIGGDTKYMITSNDNTLPTDSNLYSAKRSDLNYISKKTDDTAAGYIKFLKGIQGGQTFREGFLGEGASLYPVNGKWKLEVDDLFVRGAMTVNELIVNEIKATGGDILVSVADLEILDVSTTITNDYKCTFDTQDGTILNPFRVGDQAICQIFEGKNVKRYWRMVSEVGEDYVVLSQSVCEPGSALPEPGDKIIQLGNRYPEGKDRRSAIMISARGVDGPSITFYDNIDDFTLVNKQRTKIAKNSQFVGTLSQISGNGDIVRVPINRGVYIPGTTYYYYDQVTYEGELWLCVAISTTNPPSKDNEEWLLQVAKGEAGKPGDAIGKWVEIIGERLFMYDNPKFEGTPKPDVITLEANAHGMENPTYQWINKYTEDIIGNGKYLDVRPAMFGDRRNIVVRCNVTEGKDVYYDETQLSKLGDGAKGEDAYYVDLSNSNMTIPYDSSGNNPIIKIDNVYTYVYAYFGTNPLVIQQITASTVEGIAEVKIENDKVTLVSLGSPSARIKLTIKINDSVTLTKDLWINKVFNGEDGFNGIDAAYVMVTGEQIFKYASGSYTPTPNTITLYASVYNIISPSYKWYWSNVGENNWKLIQNEINDTLVVSPNGNYFNNVDEVSFKIEVTSSNGGATYFDIITVNKLRDGKDGESTYMAVLSNESHTIPADYNGVTSSEDINKTNTYYDLYLGSNKLSTSEYSVSYYCVDGTAYNQLSNDHVNKKYQLTSISDSLDSTVFKIEFLVGGVVVDTCDFTVAKAKGGVPGDYEVTIYAFASSQPNTPSLDTIPEYNGTPSNYYTWYPDLDYYSEDGYPAWKSTAKFDGVTDRRKYGAYWTKPIRVSGKDGKNGEPGAPGAPGGQGPSGPKGDTGPGLNYRGTWSSQKRYYNTDYLRDIVSHNGVYYVAVHESFQIVPGTNEYYWKPQNSFENIATGALFAKEATIGGWRFSPASSSYIRALSDNVCIYGGDSTGYANGLPCLAAGSGTNKGFDSSTKLPNPLAALKLYSGGTLTVGDGVVSSNAGMTGNGTSGDSVRFWAGSTFDDRWKAPFRVRQNGNLVANNCTLVGDLRTTNQGVGAEMGSDFIRFYDRNTQETLSVNINNNGSRHSAMLTIREVNETSSLIKSKVEIHPYAITMNSTSGGAPDFSVTGNGFHLSIGGSLVSASTYKTVGQIYYDPNDGNRLKVATRNG